MGRKEIKYKSSVLKLEITKRGKKEDFQCTTLEIVSLFFRVKQLKRGWAILERVIRTVVL